MAFSAGVHMFPFVDSHSNGLDAYSRSAIACGLCTIVLAPHGVVISKEGPNMREAEWLDDVAGFTIFNGWSCRNL